MADGQLATQLNLKLALEEQVECIEIKLNEFAKQMHHMMGKFDTHVQQYARSESDLSTDALPTCDGPMMPRSNGDAIGLMEWSLTHSKSAAR
eukprot:gnl/TRDRNA2_/TRDRNA2_160669_c1_seq1.p1 gnl/TRDRNA2_/TRDRNA2_160669_c1~~gnl/TRDRNA2_/TRDRNA2_160669_c1_seq1.p1  ORF type:complete len:107 (+),score=10.03 gnl/TRDRNA2_/TRDRNA2_160669_c1_seq1:48-323(+)